MPSHLERLTSARGSDLVRLHFELDRGQHAHKVSKNDPAIAVQLDVWYSLDQSAQGHPSFKAGQRRANAKVDALAEG